MKITYVKNVDNYLYLLKYNISVNNHIRQESKVNEKLLLLNIKYYFIIILIMAYSPISAFKIYICDIYELWNNI